MSENVTAKKPAKIVAPEGGAVPEESAPFGPASYDITPVAAPPKAAPYHKISQGDGFSTWHVMCDADVTVEEALHPSYLVNRMDHIRPGDHVIFQHELHEFFGHYYVVAHRERVRQLILKPIIAMILFERIKNVKADLTGAKVEYKGEDARWCVVQGKNILSQHHPKREMAEQWLASEIAR